MTPKPEIAAMEALKKPIPEMPKQALYKSYAEYFDEVKKIEKAYEHNHIIDLCIATLSNHVVMPAGEFANNLKLEIEKHIQSVMGLKSPEECLDIVNETVDYIVQKYAPEGKNGK